MNLNIVLDLPNYKNTEIIKTLYDIKSYIIKFILKIFTQNNYKFFVMVTDDQSLNFLKQILTKSDINYTGIVDIYNINDCRYKFPLPCIYFVIPSANNINIIFEDIKKNTYKDYFIFFNGASNRENFLVLSKYKNKIHALIDFNLNIVPMNHNLLLSDDYIKITNFLNHFNLKPSIFYSAKSLKCQDLSSKIKNLIDNSSDRNCSLVILDRSFDLIPLISYSFNLEALYQDFISQDIYQFKSLLNCGEYGDRHLDTKFDILYNKYKHHHIADLSKIINEIPKKTDYEKLKYTKIIYLMDNLFKIIEEKKLFNASILQQEIIFNKLTKLEILYEKFKQHDIPDNIQVRILLLFLLKYPIHIKKITDENIIKIFNKIISEYNISEIFDHNYIKFLSEKENYETSLYIPKLCNIIEKIIDNKPNECCLLSLDNNNNIYHFRKKHSVSHNYSNSPNKQNLIIYINEFLTYQEINNFNLLTKKKFSAYNIILISENIKTFTSIF